MLLFCSSSNNLHRYIFLTILIVLGNSTIISSIGTAGSNIGDNTPRVLGYIEIREYEGQDLSSINNFRENSISGPQYVDKETYKLAIIGLVKSSLYYSYDDIINNFDHYTKVTTLNCVEGWSVKLLWEGFLVRDAISSIQYLSNFLIFESRIEPIPPVSKRIFSFLPR